jgi:PKD repeat protein
VPFPFRHRAGRRHRGQALVEFALVLPLFIVIVLMAIDFGRVYFTYVQITNAAREGANFLSLSPTDCGTASSNSCASLTQTWTAVSRETNTQSQNGESVLVLSNACKDASGASITCSVATGGAGAGNTVTLTVSEGFSFLTPLINTFWANNFHISNSATSTVLGYVASGGATPPPACDTPIASFSVIVTSGTSIFADPSASSPNSGVCNISGYNWDWGDGNTSVGSASGDTYTYANAGTYTISLEVTNQGGSSTVSHSITVPATPPPTCAKPSANFSSTGSRHGNEWTYTYTDASTVSDPAHCPVTNWLWTFTGAGGSQSNAKNPAPVTYPKQADPPFSVTLQVTNAGGTDSITKSPP